MSRTLVEIVSVVPVAGWPVVTVTELASGASHSVTATHGRLPRRMCRCHRRTVRHGRRGRGSAGGIPRPAGNAVRRQRGNRCGRIRLARPLSRDQRHRAGCATIRPVHCARSRRAPVADARCGRPTVRFGPHWHFPERPAAPPRAAPGRGCARGRQRVLHVVVVIVEAIPEAIKGSVNAAKALCGTGPDPHSPSRHVGFVRAVDCRITRRAIVAPQPIQRNRP